MTRHLESVPERTVWQRALDAEPRLTWIEEMICEQIRYVRPNDDFNVDIYFARIVRRMVRPLVGWDRGLLPQQAPDDPEWSRSGKPRDIWNDPHPRLAASTRNEHWLRSSEAWDGVLAHLLALCDEAGTWAEPRQKDGAA